MFNHLKSLVAIGVIHANRMQIRLAHCLVSDFKARWLVHIDPDSDILVEPDVVLLFVVDHL